MKTIMGGTEASKFGTDSLQQNCEPYTIPYLEVVVVE
jgi:hypothetical protein